MGIAIPIKQYAWTPPQGARFQYFDEEHEYIKNVDLKATGMKYIISLIVKENLEINKKDIRISWEGVIGEYCIYINNKWSGYIEWHHFEGSINENKYKRSR